MIENDEKQRQKLRSGLQTDALALLMPQDSDSFEPRRPLRDKRSRTELDKARFEAGLAELYKAFLSEPWTDRMRDLIKEIEKAESR
jgi:hypothetical protein